MSLDQRTIDPTKSVMVRNIPFLNDIGKKVNSTRVHNLQAKQHEVEMIFTRLEGNTQTHDYIASLSEARKHEFDGIMLTQTADREVGQIYAQTYDVVSKSSSSLSDKVRNR